MRSWSLATLSFFIGYAIASLVGYALFRVSQTLMWAGMFTLMPLVFAYLAFWYFKRIRLTPNMDNSEAARLSAYWIALSFTLDAALYIVVLPATFGINPNWMFFRDQSPWIWLSYASLLFIVFCGLRLYQRLRGQCIRSDSTMPNPPPSLKAPLAFTSDRGNGASGDPGE